VKLTYEHLQFKKNFWLAARKGRGKRNEERRERRERQRGRKEGKEEEGRDGKSEREREGAQRLVHGAPRRLIRPWLPPPS
jgi:hypothetical protein